MKRLLLSLLITIVACAKSPAQGEGSVWMYQSSPYPHRGSIDFNGATPAVTYPLPSSYENTFALAVPVCYPNGQLRFTVECTDQNYPAAMSKIRNASGNWIPGTNFKVSTPQFSQAMYFPIVVPHPGNPDQYYIFHTYENGLLYSLLDMSAAGGAGALLAGQKDVALTELGAVYPNALAAVKGCSGVWVIARARSANAFYSFHVGYDGLDTHRVVSQAGLLPANDMTSYGIGKLVAASGGGKLAFISCWKGIEIYDVEPCSGVVSNSRIIDDLSSQNTFPSPWLADEKVYCPSGAFSPDGTKFYASQNRMVDTFIPLPYGGAITSYLLNGKLFQYDLAQPTLPLVVSSKTAVLTNQQAIIADLAGCFPYNMGLGDVKLAPDQKIYVDNGSATCFQAPPPGTNPAGFHVVNQPDQPAAACLPQLNAIVVPNVSPNWSDPGNPSFIRWITGGVNLPPGIVTASPLPDTVAGLFHTVDACFSDVYELALDESSGCPVWDDGSGGRTRQIDSPGIYWVRYFLNCSIRTDTFHVRFIAAPDVPPSIRACPGEGMLLVPPPGGDTATLYSYLLKSGDGMVIAATSGNEGFRYAGLGPGAYTLTVATGDCDSTYTFEMLPLPKPELQTTPRDTVIKYGDRLLLQATGAFIYTWWPSGPLDTATKASPLAYPLQPTVFTVVGFNEHGCRDTGTVTVDIDYKMPRMVPNAFSPNGDGLNDVFSVSGISFQKVSRLSVFNRNGQEVYKGMGAAAAWDGTQGGRPCDGGTYFYLIELAYPNGRQETLRGDVTLIR